MRRESCSEAGADLSSWIRSAALENVARPVVCGWPERYLADMRFCCAAKMPSASEAREPDAYRDSSNHLLDSAGPEVGTWIVTADLASVGGEDL